MNAVAGHRPWANLRSTSRSSSSTSRETRSGPPSPPSHRRRHGARPGASCPAVSCCRAARPVRCRLRTILKCNLGIIAYGTNIRSVKLRKPCRNRGGNRESGGKTPRYAQKPGTYTEFCVICDDTKLALPGAQSNAAGVPSSRQCRPAHCNADASRALPLAVALAAAETTRCLPLLPAPFAGPPSAAPPAAS